MDQKPWRAAVRPLHTNHEWEVISSHPKPYQPMVSVAGSEGRMMAMWHSCGSGLCLPYLQKQPHYSKSDLTNIIASRTPPLAE